MPKRASQWVHILLILSIVLTHGWGYAQETTPAPSGEGEFVRIHADNLSPVPALPDVSADSPTLEFDETLQQVEQVIPLLQDLYDSLDRSQFDLDALGLALNYEPEAIIEYVRHQIAFEQYPGVLRGELGTLVGHAGNAADQALLLRRLLDDAGYETRIVRGTLSHVQAAILIDEMGVARAVAPPAIDIAVFNDILSRYLPIENAQTPEATTINPHEFYQDATVEDTQLILDALQAANIELEDNRLVNQLTEEARDYFWVQYRLSAFDVWQDVHPIFSNPAAEFTNIPIDETYQDALPRNLYHRFRMEVFIEQKQGDELVVHPIVTDWERSAVELVGTPITFGNQPNNFDFESASDIESMLASSNLFLPFINGEIAPRAFDLDGNPFGIALVGPAAIGATTLVQSTAGALEGVTGALDTIGEETTTNPDNLTTLTAQWIEYTLIAPDGRETTTRRYILDRIGPLNREQGLATVQEDSNILEASKLLLTNHTIVLLSTHYNPTYRAERLLSSLLKQGELLTYLQNNPDPGTLPSNLMNEIMPVHDIFYDASLDFADASENDFISYIPEPMLLVYQEGYAPDCPQKALFERVDVINNTRRTLRLADGVMQSIPLETVRRGVWETYAERMLIRNDAVPALNTFTALRDAAAASIPLLVLTMEDVDSVNSLPYNEQTRTSVLQDVEAGYVVIIPQRVTDDNGFTGWWRVNPVTGETLGITTGGYGQQYVEYSILVSYAFFVAGYQSCLQGGGSVACCGAWNSAGLLIGVVGGLYINLGSQLANMLAFDVYYNVASYYGPSPC